METRVVFVVEIVSTSARKVLNRKEIIRNNNKKWYHSGELE